MICQRAHLWEGKALEQGPQPSESEFCAPLCYFTVYSVLKIFFKAITVFQPWMFSHNAYYAD